MFGTFVFRTTDYCRDSGLTNIGEPSIWGGHFHLTLSSLWISLWCFLFFQKSKLMLRRFCDFPRVTVLLGPSRTSLIPLWSGLNHSFFKLTQNTASGSPWYFCSSASSYHLSNHLSLQSSLFLNLWPWRARLCVVSMPPSKPSAHHTCLKLGLFMSLELNQVNLCLFCYFLLSLSFSKYLLNAWKMPG